MAKDLSPDQIRGIIRHLHEIYYAEEPTDILTNKDSFVKFHQHLEALFDWAGIESTIAENNPGEPTLSSLGWAKK